MSCPCCRQCECAFRFYCCTCLARRMVAWYQRINRAVRPPEFSLRVSGEQILKYVQQMPLTAQCHAEDWSSGYRLASARGKLAFRIHTCTFVKPLAFRSTASCVLPFWLNYIHFFWLPMTFGTICFYVCAWELRGPRQRLDESILWGPILRSAALQCRPAVGPKTPIW